jgi:transposase
VFAVRGTRAATVLGELLTDAFAGVVVCDRAKITGLGRLQWCWAHLARDFQALADSEDGVVRRLGHDLLRPTRELFRQWARCRDGTISRAELSRCLAPFRRTVEGLSVTISPNP